MIRSRGISEKIVYVYNPLPDMSETELFENHGLKDVLEPAYNVKPFDVTWQYGTGNERETVQIGPGDFLALRESEAKEFMNGTNFGDMGLCVVEDTNLNNPVVKRAATAALKKAADFYYRCGKKQIMVQRKRNNYTDADLKDIRNQLHAFFINEAKEAEIRKLLSESNHRGKPRKAEAA